MKYLLGYRSLCREIYINLVTRLTLKKVSKSFNLNNNLYSSKIENKINSIKSTIENLLVYKRHLEDGVFDKKYNSYKFETIILPFSLEFCLSTPMHIADGKGGNWNCDYQEINIVNPLAELN